jgi:hypothetical protein
VTGLEAEPVTIPGVIPTALEQFRFAAEKPAISKVCGDLIGSDQAPLVSQGTIASFVVVLGCAVLSVVIVVTVSAVAGVTKNDHHQRLLHRRHADRPPSRP